MVIDGNAASEIKTYLLDQLYSGQKWVTFSDFKPRLSLADLKCFRDYSSAEAYCEKELEYIKLISTVLRKLTNEQDLLAKNFDGDKLKDEINKYPIKALATDVNLNAELAKGELCPIIITREIQSYVEIKKYNIYEHIPPRHQYEEGHEINLLGYFDNLKEAVSNWNYLADIFPRQPNPQKPDLIMVAEFMHQKPELGPEGIPMRNSTVLLRTAHANFDANEGMRIYKFYDWQDLNQLKIEQPAFAKFNPQNNLEFFNSKLAKINTEDRLEYMELSFFSTKEVVISNPLKQNLKDGSHSENIANSSKHSQKHRNSV